MCDVRGKALLATILQILSLITKKRKDDLHVEAEEEILVIMVEVGEQLNH